ncbi:MAG: hypothetical protein SOT07_09295 [Paludibacteraceae bacterium]|nr:hypothetical protein [Paludibacteraceae bacterium]
MLLTNVGLQLFNNWRNAQTNEKITRKQQEFQRAAQEHNHDRMMELLREGQALQQQWEAENHEQRLKNINDDFDTLINQTFFQYALQNSWPLTVLPMVMKNQSLGSFRTNSNENIALHVILTPSNSPNFNNAVFPQIELGLEAFFQRHWNTMSSHPVIFYSGAWKSATAPTENDIALLRTHLKSLPVLMVTPYFQPNGKKELVFNINMWGMGNAQQTTNNNIDLSQPITIQPSEQEFSYYKIYAPSTTYSDELKATTIEEFVPYLQCMIGYLADVYFWSAHNRPPILPTLLTIGAVNTDGMKYLLSHSEDNYVLLLNETEQEKNEKIFQEKDLIGFYMATSPLLNKQNIKERIKHTLYSYCTDTIHIEKKSIDYLWEYIWNENSERPIDLYLPIEILPLLNILSRDKLLNEKKLSSLCSCISIYDPMLTYDTSELMSITEALYPHSKVRLRFVNANIVLCFVHNKSFKNAYTNCFGALLYKSETNCDGREYWWDIENKKLESAPPSHDIDRVISNRLLEKFDTEAIKLHKLFCESMDRLGETVENNLSNLISNIETKTLTYKDILVWVRHNYHPGDSLIILTFTIKSYQYVIGLLEANEQWSFKKYIGAKNFHIDASIREKMHNKSVLIQKIR